MESRLRTPQSIYECYIEYIRPQNGEDPKMKFIFPKDYEFDEDTKKSLTSFLFPIKDLATNLEEHFTFTLTNLDGQFRFGFCRYPAKGDVCMCFLSDLPWFKVFYRIMDKISDMQLDFQSELVQPFLKALHTHPIPNPPTDPDLYIKLDNVDGLEFRFPLPNPKRLLEIPTDHNLTQFYPSLHYEVFLCLFANLIFERRIIITSNSLSMLSASVHGAVSLLYPLFWQHIFIPITPPQLIDYCTAPMPFLIGVHSSILEQVKRMPINDAVILDIDENELETPYADDLLRMPPHIISQLRHKLKKSSSAYGDTVTRALLNCMVAMFGGYRKALRMREGESRVVFDEDSFLLSRPHMGNFLSELFQFQHFQQFVNHRIERLGHHDERDLFDEEAILYDEDKSGKVSSDQIKSAFKEIRGVLKRQGKSALKSTGTLVKDTQKMFHGRMERVGPGDSSTLPITQSGSKSLMYAEGGRSSNSTSPLAPKRPPRVISYQSYKMQKEKLRQSLYLQDKGLSLFDDNSVFGIASIFNEDAASLDSKESAESGEVMTGTLIDFDDVNVASAMNSRISIPVPITIIRPMSDDDDETETDSMVSSTSGSSGTKSWDVDDLRNEEQQHPPVPPPRRKHQNNQNKQENSAIGQLIDISSSESSNPNGHQSLNNIREQRRSESPLNDFTSGIAEELYHLSKRYSDPLVANSVSNTGHDLFNTVNSHNPSNDNGMISLPNCDRMSTIHEKPTNDPWKIVEMSPNLSQPRPLPPKPQPYTGSGPTLFLPSNAKQLGAVLTPTVPSTETSPSKQQDPLADIFGNGGLHGYAFQQNSSNDS